MPFGITGVLSEFAHMTAGQLHNLLTTGMLELFVDDGGTTANTFSTMMSNLRTIFQRVRNTGLSLSASKTKLFMTEVIFAGASVGPKGVQPDLSKLTAVVNWPQPVDAMNLSSFLGLTGWFRDLIKGYATIERPLRDLLREVVIPKDCSRAVYQRALRSHKLAKVWTPKHAATFITLKALLT